MTQYDKYVKFLPSALFSAYFIKILFISVSFPEACVLGVLGAATCYFQFKNNDQKYNELEERITKTINASEEKSMTAVKSIEGQINEIGKIKEQLNSFKLQAIVKPMANR